jgi:glucose/arabinose dehydrogenase
MKARDISNRATPVLAGLLLLALAGCGEHATLPASAGFGPHPLLPPPHATRIPTLNFARAVGWPAGATPAAAPGLAVSVYATGLVHPRWLHVLPNGDVLVAESDAPSTPDAAGGIRDWIEERVMKFAGAGTPSADRITLLRGVGADGLGAHTASLGLTFYEGDTLPGKYAGGAFIGQHGSWNRKPRSGYKVIFVPFADGHPAGAPEDVLTDFLNADGQARGRPVGVAVDHAGALLVADDVGGVLWRVTRRTP